MSSIITPKSEDYKESSNDFGPLTLQQAENLADFAAKRAEERMYAKIGRSVVAKVLYLIGTSLIAAAAWLAGHGNITDIMK